MGIKEKAGGYQATATHQTLNPQNSKRSHLQQTNRAEIWQQEVEDYQQESEELDEDQSEYSRPP